MKLRLHGTSAECATATQRLRRTPDLHLQDQSRPYPDRGGELVRVYLTVHLDPINVDQPGQRAGDRGSGSPRR
jgi:hypothetical protein